MSKLMTERQAWAYLARKWSKPESHRIWSQNFAKVTIGRDWLNFGLCHCLNTLVNEKWISGDTYVSMSAALVALRGRRKTQRPYLWDTTPAGARSRAAFCRKQAKLCGKGK